MNERGVLVFEFLRFAAALQPRAILIEQVKGLLTARDTSGRRGGVFAELEHQRSSLGYTVSSQVLLAADYGVPQLRERAFLVALAGDGFAFPAPTHADISKTERPIGLTPYVTVGEALRGLAAPAVKQHAADVPPADSHFDVTPPRDRERIHGVPEGACLASQIGRLPPSQICGLTKKDTTKFRRLSRYASANTLRGGEVFCHPVEDRCLTPREYMRLHGFPENCYLCGPVRGRCGRVRDVDQPRQAANSVPTPLAERLARTILVLSTQ